MGKLRVVSDGTLHGSHVYDVATGTEIGGVTAVKFEYGVGDTDARIRVDTYPASVELQTEGEVTVRCSACTDEIDRATTSQVTALTNELKIQKQRTARWKGIATHQREGRDVTGCLDRAVEKLSQVCRHLENGEFADDRDLEVAQGIREFLYSFGRAVI